MVLPLLALVEEAGDMLLMLVVVRPSTLSLVHLLEFQPDTGRGRSLERGSKLWEEAAAEEGKDCHHWLELRRALDS